MSVYKCLKNNIMKIYKYCGITKELLCITTLNDLIDNGFTGTQISKIKRFAITEGSKGYGYIDGYYWSDKEITIMSVDEELEHFYDWIDKNFNDIIKKYHKYWYYNYDLLLKCIEETIEDITSNSKTVNIYMSHILFKMKTKSINANTRNNYKNIRDVRIEYNNYETLSDDNNNVYNDMIQYGEVGHVTDCHQNDVTLYDITLKYAKEKFEIKKVEAWLMYHEQPLNKRRYFKHIAKEFGWTNSSCRRYIIKIDDYIKSKESEIMRDFEKQKEYGSDDVDNWTLNDFMV